MKSAFEIFLFRIIDCYLIQFLKKSNLNKFNFEKSIQDNVLCRKRKVLLNPFISVFRKNDKIDMTRKIAAQRE